MPKTININICIEVPDNQNTINATADALLSSFEDIINQQDLDIIDSTYDIIDL